MPGFFDFLGSLFGGSNPVPADITTNVPDLFNTPDYLGSVGSALGGGGGVDFSAFTGGGSPFDWGQITPFNPQTVDLGPTPASIFTNVPGLTSTPTSLGGLGGLGSIFNGALPGILKALSGGVGGVGGGGPATATTPGRPAATGQVAPSQPGQPAGVGATPTVPGAGVTAGVPGAAGGIPGLGGVPGLGGIPGIGGLLPGGGSFADILSAAGLLGGLLKKDSLPPQAGDLTKLADSMGQQGQNQLATATANQQGLINDQALGRVERSLRQRQASIRKSYADMGMSGSTMEAQDLNDASQAADQEVFSVGQEMATSGLQTALSMFGDQQSIMQNLMQDQIEQDKELSDAMAEFAGAAVRYDGTSNAGGGGASTAALTSGQNSLTGGVPLNIASSVINDLLGSTPLEPPQTVSPGVNVGSLISPLLNVPGLVPTGTGLPDPSQLDPTGGG